MAFCGNCGAQVEGRFCAKCGSAVGTAPPPGGGPPPAAGYPGPSAQPMVASGAMADNVASALCYVLGFITAIIFLVLAPYNQNRVVRFHAFQSIFLNVGIIVLEIGLSIIMGILRIGLLGLMFWPILGLACFILWLYMIISTYQGKTIVLPIIGPFAQQQTR